MLGLRGCRLSIYFPGIVNMQVGGHHRRGLRGQEGRHGRSSRDHDPAHRHRERADLPQGAARSRSPKKTMEAEGVEVDYMIGTMIEIPRAALTADEIAKEAQFFSFGTNDLTQMGYGISPRRRRQVPAGLHREADLQERPDRDHRRQGHRPADEHLRGRRAEPSTRRSSSASAASTAATRTASSSATRSA